MPAINKHNYEEIFLDYLEGRLDAAQTDALLQFLDANPRLNEELQGIELIRLEPDHNVAFHPKSKLKKPGIQAVEGIDENNYEEIFVAGAENDLNETEILKLRRFLQKNPFLQKEYDLIQSCRLQTNKQIVFANKNSLKKTFAIPFVSRRLYYGLAVAASLALLIGLGLLFEPGSEKPVEISGTATVKPTEQPAVSQTDNIQENNVISAENQLSGIRDDRTWETSSKTRKSTQVPAEKTFPAIREIIVLNHLAALPAPEKLYDIVNPEIESETRHYFSNYFSDIAIAQNFRHSEEMAEESFTDKLLAQGTAMVKGIMQPGEQEISIIPEEIDLWKIADAGINGFARITGADMEFAKKTNKEGKVTAFAFQSQSMQISRNLRRNK